MDERTPDCSIMSAPGGGYYGLWRITGSWHRVKTEQGTPFATSFDALRAAQSRLHGLIFKKVSVTHFDPVEIPDDGGLKSEVSAFMVKRETEREQAGLKLYGQIFAKKKGGSTRAVAVETKTRKGVRRGR